MIFIVPGRSDGHGVSFTWWSQWFQMLESAQEHVHVWFNIGTLPPASMNNVYYSEYVDWMVRYE